jgi:uncharacterized NAD(P)/FAD-binding protein YdhS
MRCPLPASKDKTLAIIGGGPAALMVYKRLVAAKADELSVQIFESTDTLGSGMPYSPKGSNVEHVTNVSADELPEMSVQLDEWVKNLPSRTLDHFGIKREDFHEKKVLPRLLFGQYLSEQFHQLLDEAAAIGLKTNINYRTQVIDVSQDKRRQCITVCTESGAQHEFDYVMICTGHHWPIENEGKVPGFFDSPYPPSKLAQHFDHPVAIRGSSLTAVDAIRTMARENGRFFWENSKLVFLANDDSPNFQVVMHSRHGLLPCIRVHMEEPHSAGNPVISDEEIKKNIEANDGFLELDFLFETGFKLPLKSSDAAFYEQIKDMNLEGFVNHMMSFREELDPFELFKKEYKEANRSIDKERPIYWKEMLSALSFAMNYPAKHLSAEDMLRLQKHLLPLIPVVIAFVPQSSCEELMALHDAGRLELIADGGDGSIDISENSQIIYRYENGSGENVQTIFKAFVNCTGQKHLSLDAFLFESLAKEGSVTHARLRFKSAEAAKRLLDEGDDNVEQFDDHYYLKVSGVSISDHFQIISTDGKTSDQIYLMAVPYMGGFNPDYSGLDFCEHASELIVDKILTVNGQNPRQARI